MRGGVRWLAVSAMALVPFVSLADSEDSLVEPMLFNGFVDVRAGVRTRDDPTQDDFSIGEARLQLEMEKSLQVATLRLVTDLLYDGVVDDRDVSLDEGRGPVDLREANVLSTPFDWMDIKLGRQILTWGTGDLVFINDLFPKDWQAFFIGRDIEYLKAPSDAIKFAAYSGSVNLDLVYTPRFDADRYIDGSRISFYDPVRGRRVGEDDVLDAVKPDTVFEDDEIAARLYGTVSGTEVALYGYRGFWKSPAGIKAGSGRVSFPKLGVYGASLRGNVGPGIGNIEVGYYDSLDDRDGDDPRVRNSEWRFLFGYDAEVAHEFTAGIQYYLERIANYREFRDSLPASAPLPDENRHVLTLRLNKTLLNQNLILSLFTFYSPSDKDGYVRPLIQYRIGDQWRAEVGGNLFFGEEKNTFFGQFEKNNNAYMAVRFSF